MPLFNPSKREEVSSDLVDVLIQKEERSLTAGTRSQPMVYSGAIPTVCPAVVPPKISI